MTRLERGIVVILIGWLMLLSFLVVTDHYGTTKTVRTTQSSTTTTEPWMGIQCMVNGYLVKTDLAGAKEAGCK